MKVLALPAPLSRLPQKLWHLGDVRRNPPRLNHKAKMI
jgi:hypothetical protein